jgi:RNA polymerase sigma-70 factor (ECF subfamily)
MRRNDMGSQEAIFSAHRSRLFGIAYRMLASRAEAEDVLQDAYLRWHTSSATDLRTPEAWLVTVVTRLCIDRLRLLKTEREAYVGPWLPEPLAATEVPSPEQGLEFATDVSIALLTVLERLTPEERAAFLLREAFELDYAEVARILGKSEAACRQLVHRANERVRAGRPRFTVSREAHADLLQRFAAAANAGNREQLAALFATDATLTQDGGGKVLAALKVLHGAERIARFYFVIARQVGARASYRPAEINGERGLLRYLDGKLDSALSFVTDGVHILDVYIVRNPDKLKALHAV